MNEQEKKIVLQCSYCGNDLESAQEIRNGYCDDCYYASHEHCNPDKVAAAIDYVVDSYDYRSPDARRDYGQKNVDGGDDEGLAADYKAMGLEK